MHDFEYKYIFDNEYETIQETFQEVSIICKIYKNKVAELYEILYNNNPKQFCVCIRSIAEKLYDHGCKEIIQLLYKDDYETIKDKTTWKIIDNHDCEFQDCCYNKTVIVSCDITEFIDNIAYAMDLV